MCDPSSPGILISTCCLHLLRIFLSLVPFPRHAMSSENQGLPTDHVNDCRPCRPHLLTTLSLSSSPFPVLYSNKNGLGILGILTSIIHTTAAEHSCYRKTPTMRCETRWPLQLKVSRGRSEKYVSVKNIKTTPYVLRKFVERRQKIRRVKCLTPVEKTVGRRGNASSLRRIHPYRNSRPGAKNVMLHGRLQLANDQCFDA